MPPVRIPDGLPFPALAYDPVDDAIEFDLEGVEALVAANPDLDWTEDTLIQVLASWCLREVEAGRPVGPAAALLDFGPVSSTRH